MSDQPPTKLHASGYRWCPHCNDEVAERTYRSHRAQFFPDGYQMRPYVQCSQNAQEPNDQLDMSGEQGPDLEEASLTHVSPCKHTFYS